MTMLRAGGLLDVLTPLSDCRQEIRRKDGTENFGGFVYVLDGFPQRDFVLWVFMCSIDFSLFFPATTLRATTPHRYRTGYHAQGYHAFTTTARLSRLCIYIPAITPQFSSIPGLSHPSYHAPPHTYIGLSHPPQLAVRSLPIISYHATCSSPSTPPPACHTYQPTPQGTKSTICRV